MGQELWSLEAGRCWPQSCSSGASSVALVSLAPGDELVSTAARAGLSQELGFRWLVCVPLGSPEFDMADNTQL